MPLTPEQIKQKRKEEYEPFRRKLDGVETIIKADHTAWWFRTMLFLKRLERSIAKDPDQYPENIRAFYELIGPTILQHLATEVGSQNSTATSAHEVILRISEVGNGNNCSILTKATSSLLPSSFAANKS